ncbi:1309_t:CDS:2 [Rhizophagus irregularis]|nr:1309_t:CDS:2 [Rhizophagus irregularis]
MAYAADFNMNFWYLLGKNIEQFDQAEIKREELISSKKLGPEFSEVPHPKAIYTSRSLSPYISEYYISRELEFDID